MSIVTTSPTLSYVSSQDVAISPSGTTNYMILFDASNTLLSNIIMFEYKFQNINANIPDLSNTRFGFVAVENAIQSGIANQYIISVPVDTQTLDGVPLETIQVRVYYGDKASSDVIVSEWSNQLDSYLPPVTPVIYTSETFQGSYYDPSLNDLFVLLQENENDFSYNSINFIVCFFYQDVSNVTIWKVSEPTHALETIVGSTPFRYIQVPLEGVVSTNPLYQKVYVSIHAVYSWQILTETYHSVSYISNEVEAIQPSSDNNPDITSVNYNVYTSPKAVPGNQTMTVNWIPPGNSGVPLFAVQYYQLYYQLNGSGPFILYANNIPSNTLSYTVNVGSSGPYLNPPLNLGCGNSIIYRVNAIDAQGTNTPSDVSTSTNIFKYSQAVTNLTITNATYNGTVNFNVNFQGVYDNGFGIPNKGCGTGLQYVVKINDSDYIGTGSLSYVSGQAYSIQYTGLNITQVGTVSVYLQTQNTNPTPASPLNGLTASVPYIANTLTLNPVVYQIYNTQLNTSQIMNLSWSNPELSGWVVDNYTIQYNSGSGWTTATTTNLQTYSFDSSAFAVSDNPPVNLSFKVLANMTNNSTPNNSTHYIIVSNTVSKYTFKYAEDVQQPQVNWAVSNTNNTNMDLNVQFNNPLVNGVNNGLQEFVVTVLDQFGNAILGASKNISYVAGSSPYIVFFDNINYSPSGSVRIAAFVKDPNNGDTLITSPNYEQDPGYTTSTVPLFQNVNVTTSSITGDIITYDVLKPTGVVFIPSTNQSTGFLGTPLPYSTLNTTSGFTISYVTQPNNTLKYSFTINIATFFAEHSRPTGISISASNNAGIGVSLPLPIPSP